MVEAMEDVKATGPAAADTNKLVKEKPEQTASQLTEGDTPSTTLST